MKDEPSDRPNPKLLYWSYAASAWIGGFVLTAWGPLWFGSRFPAVSWGSAAIVRVVGAFILAAGCFAASLATMEDPLVRRRARVWFLAANAIVCMTIIVEQPELWGGGLPQFAAQLLFVVVLLGVFLAAEAEDFGRADVASMITLFGGTSVRPSIEQLRSRYERQIRDAAGQEERNRLARELHDSIKQQLFVIQTAAATVQTRWDEDVPGARSALDQVRASARDAMTEMEVMLDQLRAAPLENVGLVEALKKQCEALGLRTGASVSFHAGDLPPADRLPPGAQQAVFRVAQEALANVARHARATHVRVALDGAPDEMRLAVEDDGVGFEADRASGGMGLANMQQRASAFGGDLIARSAPGGGTRIVFRIPCLREHREIPDHRLQAKIWAVMLVFQVALGLWKPVLLPWAIIPTGMLVRAVTQFRRRRRTAQGRP